MDCPECVEWVVCNGRLCSLMFDVSRWGCTSTLQGRGNFHEHSREGDGLSMLYQAVWLSQ